MLTYVRWLGTFVAVLLAAGLLLVLGLLHVRSVYRRPDALHHMLDPSFYAQERAFTLRGAQCEVLIAGDSTASTGVDPRVITAKTGLRTCSIASTRSVWDALDTVPVDAFLAHNPPPRLLILQFGPEVFYRSSDWGHIGLIAPYLLMFRQLPAGGAAAVMLRHPAETLQVLGTGLRQELKPMGAEERTRLEGVWARTIPEFEASGGRLNLEHPPLAACDMGPRALYGPVDAAWIDALRKRYTAQGIVTLIEAAPVPQCDTQLGQFARELRPYVDGDTEAMPVDLFVTGDRHMNLRGAQLWSEELSRQIETRLGNAH